MTALLSILGTGVLCAFWVLVQRWIARHDPGQPGVDGKCHSCGPKDTPGRIDIPTEPTGTIDNGRFPV